MNVFHAICTRIRSFCQQREVKREIDEELRFHLEQRTAEYIAAGMSPAEAGREARRRFGNVQKVREECRDRRRASFGEAAQRRREIGVRMALGALLMQIGRHFLVVGLRLLLAGTVLGVLGAWVTGRAMQSILFQVPPLHVATLAGTAVVLGIVSLGACLVPALRASHVHPMEALREE